MKYKVILNSELTELINEVNEALKNGWKCQGGIVVVLAIRVWYYQAMIYEIGTSESMYKF